MTASKPVRTTRRAMMAKSPGDTRQRILDAARQELVAHGFAGARMDRIARIAKTSKERIYHYFRTKEEIADAIAARHTASLREKVKFDPGNIDGFIGDLFDFYFNNPDEVRLWLWFLLEQGNERRKPDASMSFAIRERIETVRTAQAGGHIHPDWNPVVLLDMLVSLAVSRVLAPAYVHDVAEKELGMERGELIRHHRAAVIEISHRLLASPPTVPQAGG